MRCPEVEDCLRPWVPYGHGWGVPKLRGTFLIGGGVPNNNLVAELPGPYKVYTFFLLMGT